MIFELSLLELARLQPKTFEIFFQKANETFSEKIAIF